MTEASPFEQHVFLLKLKTFSEHDLLTVDDLLALRYVPNRDGGPPVTDARTDRGITAKTPAQTLSKPDAMLPPAPVPAAVAPPMVLPPIEAPPAAPGLSPSILSSELFLAAALAAIAVEGPSRAEWTDPQSRRQAWGRLMTEASYHFERLKRERPGNTDHQPPM
ncbi:hypothetical protein ACIU1J_26475 [Azospirillum doebereinerae]|uniref:hypothetical protein n=1 Tax=Azospirillum doebereinerae TaxID=92933 RepID=UPI001EE4EFAD|nr:hypothetical protein [Azospirillum doebereinerae]MCG5243622.1 hypothetical protein [Azospirillum doebereinerae]